MDQQNPSAFVSYNSAPLQTSTLAIMSLVFGILGFTAFPIIGSIVALITGYAARKETRSIPPRAAGDGMATAGIVLGWVEVGLAVVGFLCFVAYMVLIVGIVSSGNQ